MLQGPKLNTQGTKAGEEEKNADLNEEEEGGEDSGDEVKESQVAFLGGESLYRGAFSLSRSTQLAIGDCLEMQKPKPICCPGYRRQNSGCTRLPTLPLRGFCPMPPVNSCMRKWKRTRSWRGR